MGDHTVYETPFAQRYASDEMLSLFSADTRYKTWRKLWVALAETEMELGLNITAQQVEQLKAHVDDDIDYALISAKEKEIRHDVMAHVFGYGAVCPDAAGIIHLGATSCYVTDNADLIIYRQAMELIKDKLAALISRLSDFALQYKALPALGYTHLQPAQLVTVGKRACLWLQDLALDYDELCFCLKSFKLLGSKGTTGTQASFLELFDGDHEKVKLADKMIAEKMGFDATFGVSGQTYPRKFDSRILNVLSSIAQSLYRLGNDIRLLQHMKEIEEPFEKNQVGSSAMAYKRNPMRSERICSIARYVMADAMNAPMTASVQWFERTLDDSANRRISIPEGFLATDSILKLALNVTNGLVVNEKIIQRHIKENIAFIATENILMAGVKAGGDRQKLHEAIRRHSMAALERMKYGDGVCDLLERIASDNSFPLDIKQLESELDPAKYIGRCPQQVEEYIRNEIRPILRENGVKQVDSDISI